MLTFAERPASGRYPAIYIRESSEDAERDPDKARTGQRLDCQRLAERDGWEASILVEFDDWGRSGSRGKARPAQDSLIAEMAGGRVAVVYARSEDRLMRDVRGMMAFEDAARENGVRIVTEREGDVTAEDEDAGFLHRLVRRGMAEQESRLGKLRARKAVATKRREGIPIGQVAFGERAGEDVAAVVQAFREAGTYNGAARLLIERGVKSRRGHLRSAQGQPLAWAASTIKRILLRELEAGRADGIVLPLTPHRGSRTVAAHYFSRLLVCPHDGTLLTIINRKDASPAYICREGHRGPKGVHPRPYAVAESAILPWAKEQTAWYDRMDVHQPGDPDPDAVARIEAKRAVYLAQEEDGVISREQRRAKMTVLDEEERALARGERAYWQLRRGVDWSAPVGEVNAALRALWQGIRLAYVPAVPLKGRHADARLALVPVEPIPQPGVLTPAELEAAEEDRR